MRCSISLRLCNLSVRRVRFTYRLYAVGLPFLTARTPASGAPVEPLSLDLFATSGAVDGIWRPAMDGLDWIGCLRGSLGEVSEGGVTSHCSPPRVDLRKTLSPTIRVKPGPRERSPMVDLLGDLMSLIEQLETAALTDPISGVLVLMGSALLLVSIGVMAWLTLGAVAETISESLA